MPAKTSLELKSKAVKTISLTPFALAPGVLKTTIPFSEHASIGMVLTPTPARAMANKESGNVCSCRLKDLTT